MIDKRVLVWRKFSSNQREKSGGTLRQWEGKQRLRLPLLSFEPRTVLIAKALAGSSNSARLTSRTVLFRDLWDVFVAPVASIARMAIVPFQATTACDPAEAPNCTLIPGRSEDGLQRPTGNKVSGSMILTDFSVTWTTRPSGSVRPRCTVC